MSTSAKTAAAERLIKRDIMNGAFAPEAQLRLPALSQRYALSATPLREALSRLAEQGFVASTANCGWRVAGVSVAQMEDLQHTRLTLEIALIAEAIAQGGLDWEAGIVAAHHRMSRVASPREQAADIAARQRWIAAHEAFHGALVAGGRSAWLRRFRDLTCEQIERHHQAILFAPETFGAIPTAETAAHLAEALSLAAHGALMEAVLDRDADAAAAALRAHVAITLRAYRSLRHTGTGAAQTNQ